jgi:hydrogenase maturation protein HypF
VCFEHAAYEGQAAITFEALADARTLHDEDDALAYPFGIPRLADDLLPYIEPLAMWQALLGDLILDTPVGVISARFHKGLAIAIARMVDKLSRHESPDQPIRRVALSGGVFQNAVLLEQVVTRLHNDGFDVLTHHRIPASDGGLAMGQAMVAAAHVLHRPPR